MNTRLLAFALDILLLFTLVGITDYLTFSSDEEALLLKPERFLDLLLCWIYFSGAEICPCQATLGKYLLALKVVKASGERLSFRQATVRFFAKPITLFLIIFRFLSQTQSYSTVTFHDKLANAQVVTR